MRTVFSPWTVAGSGHELQALAGSLLIIVAGVRRTVKGRSRSLCLFFAALACLLAPQADPESSTRFAAALNQCYSDASLFILLILSGGRERDLWKSRRTFIPIRPIRAARLRPTARSPRC